MATDLFHEGPSKPSAVKTPWRLYRRLFLLVCAVAVLAQGLLLVEKKLADYYRELYDTFKILLVLDTVPDNAALTQMGETLNQKEDIASVRLFSAQDALEVVRRQNPQLVQNLVVGRNQMPAYFELRVTEAAVRNVSSLAANLAAEYTGVTPYYQAEHARLVFITGVYVKLLRVALLFAGILLLGFMFLVEAYPAQPGIQHTWSAAVSGVLAGVLAGGFFAGLLYPFGLLDKGLSGFTTFPRQLLVAAFCGLLGWTLSKWQKF